VYLHRSRDKEKIYIERFREIYIKLYIEIKRDIIIYKGNRMINIMLDRMVYRISYII